MNRYAASAALIAISLLAIGFSYLNGGAVVTLRFGFATLHRVQLTWVVFTSLIAGMGIMLAAGARADRRVREILREKLAAENERERAQLFIDRDQQDLFDSEPELERRAAPRVVVSIESLAPDNPIGAEFREEPFGSHSEVRGPET